MMSLMERLMKLDRDKLLEIPTEKVKACHLSKIAGEEVEISEKIGELSGFGKKKDKDKDDDDDGVEYDNIKNS